MGRVSQRSSKVNSKVNSKDNSKVNSKDNSKDNSNGNALHDTKRLEVSKTLHRSGAASKTSTPDAPLRGPRAARLNTRSSQAATSTGNVTVARVKPTAIEQCVQHELRRYFDMLDGEDPANLYRMVIRQAECALVNMVMDECRGNQTRASEWLGISRGNLRTKLASMDK